jgi:hypothetical protein
MDLVLDRAGWHSSVRLRDQAEALDLLAQL